MNERPTSESFAKEGGTSRLPRGGRLLGPLFGMVFLIYPVRAVLTSDPTPARVSLALGGAALFAGVFLWSMWTRRPLRSAGSSENSRRRVTIAFLAVLAVSLSLVLGGEWLVLFFHVNIAAGMLLPTRDAYVTIAGLALVTFTLGVVSGMAWLALPTAALGLWATAFVRQLAAVAELRSAREELARLAVNEERLRFARDLHDLLGHSLSLITLKSELAGRFLSTAPEKARTEVEDIEEVARQALREVREAVAGYRNPTLDEELVGASELLGAAGIDCRIENRAGVLPGAVDGVLAWTVREGATNVIRHSRAKSCRIILARNDREVQAEITDNGRGKSGEETPGSGLSGLAERVGGFGDGKFEAGPLREGGFRLCVRLPLERVAADGEEGRR
jgi:two-component system, NarL family, sensor histidine kinase DesK